MVTAPETAPGQALYAQLRRRFLESAPVPPAAWMQAYDDLDPMDVNFLEDAAQTVIDAFLAAAAQERAATARGAGLDAARAAYEMWQSLLDHEGPVEWEACEGDVWAAWKHVADAARGAAQERPAPGVARSRALAAALRQIARESFDAGARATAQEALDSQGTAPAGERPAPGDDVELAALRKLLRLNRQLVVTLRRIGRQQEDGGHAEAAYATGCAATMVEALWPVCNEKCTDTTHHHQPEPEPAGERPAPELAAATPGQRAYEGFVAFQKPDGFEYETWADKDETGDNATMGRADWEAAAQAVAKPVEAQRDQAMHRVRELTNGILATAEALEESAAKTAPSAKSRAEKAAAEKIRALLDVSGPDEASGQATP